MTELATPSGMRDFLPEAMQRREYVLDTIRAVYRQWGFLPLETPAMERWETLAGKYGEEGEKLIYHCFNSGNLYGEQAVQFTRNERPELALRYDLTVPLARVMSMYGQQLAKPFKRYQIQSVWRGDRPGAGRFREFTQCDGDVVGSNSLLVDAELIGLTHQIMVRLGFTGNFTIRLNHRQILRGLIEVAGIDLAQEATVLTGIDKLDKLPVAKVQQELESKGIDRAAAVLAIVTDPQANQLPYLAEVLKDSRQGQNGVAQLQQILDYLAPYGLATGYTVDLSLARGLDYYTGTIFETVTAANIGSVGGGGRYDKLIETLSGGRVDLPAAGTSLGLDRLLTAMEKLDLFQQISTPKKILVTFFTNPALAQVALQLVNQLRGLGLPAELYYGESEFKPNALRKQLGYAESRGMSHVLITGPDEVSRGEVTLKSMQARHQENIPLAEVAQHLAQL